MQSQQCSQRNHWYNHVLALLLTVALSWGLTQPVLAALVWQTQIVDSAGGVGEHTTLVLDSSDHPVISYTDSPNGDLKLVRCGNATCTSGNTIQTVDSAGNVGLYTSLALDSSGHPVISYYDSTNSDLKLAHCGNATCTGGNVIQTVDSVGAVGYYTSLALDSSGHPVISYYDGANGDLKLAYCGDATCTSGNTIQTVDSAGDVGYDSSLALDSSGHPVISYYDGTNGDLKLAYCGDPTCTSPNTIQTVDSAGSVGSYTALALDSSGHPVISYRDNTNGDLKLAYCGNATCTNGNTIQTVDSAGNVGYDSSLALDSSGHPVISYRDSTNGDLKLAYCGNATCTSPNTIQTVDSVGSVGYYSSLALDSSGHPVISHYDVTFGDLRLARIVDDERTPPTINASASQPDNTPYLADSWTNQNVTVHFTCSDSESGIATCPNDQHFSLDGLFTASGTATDKAGNSATTSFGPIRIDKSAPLVTVTGVSNGASYTVGSVPVAGCSTTDAHAGVATPATLTVTGGNGDGTGLFTATCSGATDKAGNSDSTTVSYTVNVAPPTITIVLDARPNISTNLAFSGNLGAILLDDAQPDDGDAVPNQRTFTVTPGSYTVRRNNNLNWFTNAIVCTPENNAVVNLAQRSATVTVVAGQNVTCTFTEDRAVSMRAHAFNDLVRKSSNLGKRNAGDPWLQGWTMTVFSAPNTVVVSNVTQATAVADLYEAFFQYIRPGSYTLCTTLPAASWTPTTPAALDPAYGQPCKAVTLAPGQTTTLLFGAYQASVAASEAMTTDVVVVTDEDLIGDRPYDPDEEERIPAEQVNHLFLPLVNR